MWIVRLALKRTYTFVVVAVLIAVLGVVSIYRMSTDIFPSIDIPVVSVVWSYNGAALQALEDLDLGGTKVTQLKHLGGVKGLRMLAIGNTDVTDIGIRELAGLKELTSLTLQCTAVTDAGLKELTPLQTLLQLDLCNTGRSEMGLQRQAWQSGPAIYTPRRC